MKKTISSQKVGTKGYLSQAMSSTDKQMGGKKVINKLTMPVKFTKGIQNPVKQKNTPTGISMLAKIMKKFKK